MNTKRTLYILLIAGLAVVLIVFLTRFLSPSSEPTAPRDTPVASRIVQPRLRSYHKGDVRWYLEAEEIEEVLEGEDQGTAKMRAITEGILYREDQPDLYFVADRALHNLNTNDFILEGDVQVYEEGTLFFASERVEWHADDERLTSPVRARLNRDGQTVEADRLDTYVQEDRTILQGNVVWTTESGMRVHAAEAVYDGVEGHLEFRRLDGPARFVMGEETH